MKKWEIKSDLIGKSQELRIEKILEVLLKNRGVKNKKDREEFLHPKLKEVTAGSVDIDKKQLLKAVSRIKNAINNKEQIVVFGDYDVDGICGTAILWETLYSLGARVTPYIPHRVDEGYGLSSAGISKVIHQLADSKIKLIITVDNGIVANEAVKYANEQGIDVIITDHHVSSETLPDAYAIVHTTKLCGAGVGYLLSREFKANDNEDAHLELVVLATIADLVPLIKANRTFTKYGLEALRRTKRVGLLELFKEAGLNPVSIGVYEVGHIIAPRLNAMGRLEYAMDSLRLLCTKNQKKVEVLAQKLGSVNRERQLLTRKTVIHAKAEIMNRELEIKKLLFIAHETYQQGVIGLVAGKLVEEYYRPAIVVSIGQSQSKASARSVAGFNIIDFIRQSSDLLINAGGHPMAAGFTVETTKLASLQQKLEESARELLNDDLLIRTLYIDLELPLSLINPSFYEELQNLAPFGMSNPEPVFVGQDLIVDEIKAIGRDGKHLKMKLKTKKSKLKLDGVGFWMGELVQEIRVGDAVDIVYSIDMNVWNGNRSLQLKIKDLKLSKNPGASSQHTLKVGELPAMD